MFKQKKKIFIMMKPKFPKIEGAKYSKISTKIAFK
jgi:hypothetical protein